MNWYQSQSIEIDNVSPGYLLEHVGLEARSRWSRGNMAMWPFSGHFWGNFPGENLLVLSLHGYGSIPINTCLVGWTSIYQLFWGSLGTRVLTHPHVVTINPKPPVGLFPPCGYSWLQLSWLQLSNAKRSRYSGDPRCECMMQPAHDGVN